MLSEHDLKQIETLALASTEGELSVAVADPLYRPIDFMMECLSYGQGPVHCVLQPEGEGEPVAAVTGNGPTSKANAEFYSIARKAVLALVVEVRCLRPAAPCRDDLRR